MSSAIRPAVEGTASATNPIPDWSRASGPSGTACGQAPRVATAWARKGSCAAINAATSQPIEAPLISSTSCDTSTLPNAEISAYATNTIRAIVISDCGLTRRSSATLGTSTSTAAAIAERSAARSNASDLTR